MKVNRRVVIASVLILLLVAAWSTTLANAQGLRLGDSSSQYVVQLIAADEGRGGRLTAKWTGSGVIISPDGLILTNCQVAIPRSIWDDSRFDYDLLIVSISLADGDPPQPTYVAEVVQYDAGLDLAVLRITQTLDGSPVASGSLHLPSVAAVGDSDTVQTGDALQVLGYPDTAGSPLFTVDAQVTGFASGRGVAGRAWMRTDASLAGGISGGPAVNAQGELVAVAAVGAAGSADDVLHCRFSEDTNGDGNTDQSDLCVATGGATGALRPVNLAAAMIQAASAGIEPEPTTSAFPTTAPPPTATPAPGPTRTVTPTGPRIARTIFAPSVNDYDQPWTVVGSFPSGAEDIYLLFDYVDFQDDALWHPVLVYEGEVYNDVWEAETWWGGRQGTSWVSIHNEPLVDGLYEFVFYLDDQEVGSASVHVGGQASTEPTISNVAFSAGGYEGYILPTGAAEVEVTFDYDNFGQGDTWSYVWYRDGEEIDNGDGPALNGSSGTAVTTLPVRGGLDEGTFRLDLYVGNRLAATADFIAGSGVGGGELFGPITFAPDIDRNEQPMNPGTTLDYGTKNIYAFFDYQGMREGWTWTRQWYLDGQAVTTADDTWKYGESGEDYWVAIGSDDSLPQGEYRLELYVEDELVQQGTVSISGSGAPIPTPTPVSNGVEFYGILYDAATNRGIPGAFFLVLRPGITADEFTWAEDEVYTWAQADSFGYYELPLLLIRGETYSVIIGAEGYHSVAEDGIYVGDDADSSYEIDIALTKVR